MQVGSGFVHELDGRFDKTCGSQASEILNAAEGTGNAAYVRAALSSLVHSEMVLGNDVSDTDSTAGNENAEHFPQDCPLVSRQVNHTVRDHDIDRVTR